MISKADKVIHHKVINCSPLRIRTTGVVIKKSKINGAVLVGSQDSSDPRGNGEFRVIIRRSEIDAGAGSSGYRPISYSHYIVTRSYLHGAYSGAECHNRCKIKWSYVEGQGSHSSGMRILRNGKLKHNTIWCKPNSTMDDGGCSGNLTMYQEFGTPRHNVVKNNYFPSGRFWYNLKFNGEDNGRIRIVDNLFGRPRSGGGLADGWDGKRTNVWSGNRFPNGGVARP